VATTVGLFLLFTTPKKVVQGGENDDQKTHDEVKGFWQYFGLVDDTPNMIRAVVAGNENKGPIIRYIANVTGMKYDPDQKMLVPLEEIGKDNKGKPIFENPYADESLLGTFLREKFGKRIYGWPIINNIRPLQIDRVVRAKTTTEKLTLADQLSASSVKRYGLKVLIFRPTFHDDLDTNDGIRFSVISYATLEVFNPEPAFTVYNDDLLPNISEIISGLISLKVLPNSWNHYKTIGKEIQPHELTHLNQKLESMGVKIRQLTMSDPEINSDMQKTLEIKKTAVETAAARKLAGTGEKDYAIEVGKGQAKAIEIIAVAKASRFAQLIDLYIKNGWSNKEAVDKANAMISAEFNADAIGKLTTYVAGGAGIQITTSGGEKK
jgi:hypothetical protein